MNRATINISMPESMRKFIEQRVGGGNYGSVSEYIRELIRRDQNLMRRTSQFEPQQSEQQFSAPPFIHRVGRNG